MFDKGDGGTESISFIYNSQSTSCFVVLLVFSQLYHPHRTCLSFNMSTTATCPRDSRMSSFLTLSILNTLSILHKHIISQAHNLLYCPCFALKTYNFVSFFNSLRSNTSFLIAPITLIAAPTHCSISSSLDPSVLLLDPKIF